MASSTRPGGAGHSLSTALFLEASDFTQCLTSAYARLDREPNIGTTREGGLTLNGQLVNEVGAGALTVAIAAWMVFTPATRQISLDMGKAPAEQ